MGLGIALLRSLIHQERYICEGKEIKCDVKEDGDPNDLNQDNLFALNWSRFGNVTLEKWSKSKSGWVLQ